MVNNLWAVSERQKSAIGPYNEQMNPHTYILFLEDQFYYYIFSYAQGIDVMYDGRSVKELKYLVLLVLG